MNYFDAVALVDTCIIQFFVLPLHRFWYVFLTQKHVFFRLMY